MDSTGLDILSKLVRLGQRKQVCLQWIPSHVGVPGNEAADELAGRGCDLPKPSSIVLTHTEIHSFQRNKMNLTWRNPPARHRNAAESSGLSLQCRSSRAYQTALTRFRSGHLRSMTFVQGDALRRNRRQYEQLTDFDRGRIIGLREAGWSNRRIGRHLGRSDMVVARCWQQWITEGRVYRRGGSGRPRNTNDREDRAIRRVATSAPTTSLASIQRHLPPSRHPVPSRETIRRRLTEVGLRSRRPLRRLPLTPHHRQCRLDFADLGQLGV
ncbi:HTH_38 domain-containing protein [Trichonephila clavipes]|nr:HTH_38 domain-containing protein [Trichonephila clavipes]